MQTEIAHNPGVSMRHTRLVGTEPHNSAVQRRCCRVCKTPIYDLRPVKVEKHYKFRCSSCQTLVATQILDIDDWHQVHAIESERHKRGMVPDAVFYERGNDETEARSARAKSRLPSVQMWFEYAHDDTWKYSDRYPSIRKACVGIIMEKLSKSVVDAACAVFERSGSCPEDAQRHIKWITGQAIDMLRVNQAEPPRIRRKFFAAHFKMDSKSFRSYTRIYTDDMGARQGRRYSPPLSVLLDSIELAVSELESNF